MSELDGSGGVLGGSGGVKHMVSNVERLLPLLDRDGSVERLRIAAQCIGDLQFRHDNRASVSQMDGSNLGARHRVRGQCLHEVGHVIQQRQLHCNG